MYFIYCTTNEHEKKEEKQKFRVGRQIFVFIRKLPRGRGNEKKRKKQRKNRRAAKNRL